MRRSISISRSKNRSKRIAVCDDLSGGEKRIDVYKGKNITVLKGRSARKTDWNIREKAIGDYR